MIYKNIIRPILFRLDPEETHDLTHHFATSVTDNEFILGIIGCLYKRNTPLLEQKIYGLSFGNPVGLAAGFDKNGLLLSLIHALGFGYSEIGSITAESSLGNPKPRLFRLPTDHGLINRMGLNNDGAENIINRLKSSTIPPFPIGINIAKTHNSRIIGDAAINDYLHSYNLAKEVADYITINISCPNTEEGKTFEDPVALDQLLTELLKNGNRQPMKPVFVKLSADLTENEIQSLVSICEQHQVNGYVATNTSSKREFLPNTDVELIDKIGRGGLSGKPLISKTTRVVSEVARLTDYKKPIIAVGGIDSAKTAIEMIKAGAWLLQVYTGLIYEGVRLPGIINQGISQYMLKNGFSKLEQIRNKSLPS